MQKFVLASILALLPTVFTSACASADDTAEGEGEGSEGEGEGEGGEGEGEGEGGEGEGEGEAGCGTGAACEADETCASLFQAQGGGLAPPSCYKTCATANESCTTILGLDGTCTQAEAGLVCLSTSPLNGPCGNDANASCSADASPLCVTLTDESGNNAIGLCARLCTPATPTTCGQAGLPAAACGCGTDTGLGCSTDIQLQGGDGLCAPTSAVGDACGLDATTGVFEMCTDSQTCDATAKTCAAPTETPAP